MSRQPRQKSSTGLYHVTARGNAHQLIFEDDNDRMALLERLKISFRLSDISVQYFNTRHQRVGHLFQDRFYSTPILGDSQFLTAIDYVHLNPARASGGPVLGHRWSSLNAFVLDHDEFDFCDMNRAQELAALSCDMTVYLSHLNNVLRHDSLVYGMREKVSDEDALKLLRYLAAPFEVCDIKALKKPQRNEIMLRARMAGMTVHQLARCCGLGEATVKRATSGWRQMVNDPFSSVPKGSSRLLA